MAALVLRNIPPALHQRLKDEAQRHHRSMNREILAILENEVGAPAPRTLPPPVRGRRPADPQWVVRAIREARDGTP